MQPQTRNFLHTLPLFQFQFYSAIVIRLICCKITFTSAFKVVCHYSGLWQVKVILNLKDQHSVKPKDIVLSVAKLAIKMALAKIKVHTKALIFYRFHFQHLCSTKIFSKKF